jgi:hypothetical protein
VPASANTAARPPARTVAARGLGSGALANQSSIARTSSAVLVWFSAQSLIA